jgi:hypothetical protein
MPALERDYAVVTHHFPFQRLRRGSQPVLVAADDGLLYLAKFIDNPQGPNVLFNECAGSELYQACGLACPSWKPLLLTESFIDHHPDCWMETPQGRLRPAPGLCFGSRYLDGGGTHVYDFLPGDSFKRVRNRASFWLAWLVDACAEHSDSRQAVFVENADRSIDAFFVDHGHLFGGPGGNQKRPVEACSHLDPRIYPQISSGETLELKRVAHTLNLDRLARRIVALPDEWRKPSALESFARCLKRLSAVDELIEIFDGILRVHASRSRQEREPSAVGRLFPNGLLRRGVPNPVIRRTLVRAGPGLAARA